VSIVKVAIALGANICGYYTHFLVGISTM